ncbi:hypothetical protein AAFF_G00045110 [Aldrovandia affinis]|uniref:Tf2-1-like SH3-like domain-containing protein n=1 Tax=Aldrovandia affinis TaxID=143900 RepID=A0AAD7S1Z5_9TELE|nr:hypothetical protein AAFF_G00045110 [Aldrovandia affinis]
MGVLQRCLSFYQVLPSLQRNSEALLEYAHNTLRCSTTGMSPYEAQFGYQPPLFPDQERETGVPSAEIHRVWLSAWDLPLKVENRKLAPHFVGPFKVVRRVNLVAYRLLLSPEIRRIHPTFHMDLNICAVAVVLILCQS